MSTQNHSSTRRKQPPLAVPAVRQPPDDVNLAFDFELRATLPEKTHPAIRIGPKLLQPTPVFSAYWRFAAERQRIFFRRLGGTQTSLTDDPVLQLYKFTNAYRASDRVSQYLIRNVIYRPDLPTDAKNVFFRILLFKLFNKIETWSSLEDEFGALTWEEFDYRAYDRLLAKKMAGGERIYSAAYIMPSAGAAFGNPLKHQNHLRLLQQLIKDGFAERTTDSASMEHLYGLLLSAPSIGPFLAYQFATDLNYSEITDFSEAEFVVAGPGALDGIAKCFSDAASVSPNDIIRYMFEHQDQHFADQGIDFPALWGRPLQLIDCQNLFCEISKYSRVAFPAFTGSAGRTRIKQKFQRSAGLPPPWYPPKWGINDEINAVLPSGVGDVTKSERKALQGVRGLGN